MDNNQNQQMNQQTQRTTPPPYQGPMKICKHCNANIPKSAKKCQYCGHGQGSIIKWVIIGFVAICIIGAAASGEGDNKNKETNNAKIESSEEPKIDSQEVKEDVATEANKTEKPSKKKDEKNELTVGSSFEKKGLKITVDNANLDYKDYPDDYGLYDPGEGMKYVMASFTFENSGKSDAYVSIYDFDCYADNASCEQAYLPDDSNFININLSPGRNISFKTYYKVPVNAGTVELEYETSFWTNEKAIIKLQ